MLVIVTTRGTIDTGRSAPIYGPSADTQGEYVYPVSNMTACDQIIVLLGYLTHAGSSPLDGFGKSLSLQKGFA